MRDHRRWDETWVKGEQVKLTTKNESKEGKKLISFRPKNILQNFLYQINYLKISIRLPARPNKERKKIFVKFHLSWVYEDKRPFEIFITFVLCRRFDDICVYSCARDNTQKFIYISLKGMSSYRIHELKLTIFCSLSFLFVVEKFFLSRVRVGCE